MKLKIGMLDHTNNTFRNTVFQISVNVPLTKLPKIATITIFLVFCIFSLLFRCGHIEKNSGPKYSSLTFCHRNLNGLISHDSIKILLLQAYITQHNYGAICLSETFMNSCIDSSATRASINGYNFILVIYIIILYIISS